MVAIHAAELLVNRTLRGGKVSAFLGIGLTAQYKDDFVAGELALWSNEL